MLRTLHKDDLPQLLIIEQLTQVAPWTADVFDRCLKAGYFGWVIEQENNIVGFILLSLQARECHILNVCVHPQFQRKGLGRQLIAHALNMAKNADAGIVFLEVRRSNQHAIALYQKQGFVQIGERKGYYPSPEGREDALVLAIDLTPIK